MTSCSRACLGGSRRSFYVWPRTRGDTIAGFSHQDLADRAGITRETMTHTLDKFAQMGAVELHRLTVMLRDREMLEALAAR